MPHEGPRTNEGEKEPRQLFGRAFAYFEELEDAATQLAHRLEIKNRVEALTPEDLDVLEAATEQNEICEEMLAELEQGNIASVIAYLERTTRELLDQKEFTQEGNVTVAKAGQALQELRAAQATMLH